MNWRTRLVVALAGRLPHPEPPTQRYLARMRREPPRGLVSQALLGTLPSGVRVADRALPAPVSRPARWYQRWPRGDDGRRPLVVNFHAGGFVIGNLANADWLCAQVATRTGALVVSVSYRLAPEHPAPAPFEDCWAATRWLVDHAAEVGADPERVSVMGASAGGTLAALVALAHRDRCRADPTVPPLRRQILIYPATDMTLSSASVAELANAPILTRDIMDWYGRRYLPQDGPDAIPLDDPRVSPLFATDHTDLAPALLIAAGQDPLRDDATRYAEVLRAAGVPARMVTFAEAIHGFVSMPRIDPAARQAVETICAEF